MADEPTRVRVRRHSRRELLQRGGIIAAGGVGAAWAAPAIQSLAAPGDPGSPAVACGRMTGGGKFEFDNISTSGDGGGGFTLHCNLAASPPHPQNLVVTFKDANNKENEFKLVNLDYARCTDDPTIDQGPNADFDTFVGKGTGTLRIGNGPAMDGYRIEFMFVDAGEPGNADYGTLTIYGPGDVVIRTASGQVDRGNLQAHYATGTRSC